MMTLRLASGQEATWHLPLVMPDIASAAGGPIGLGEQWGLILALLGGMLAAMWPCLFQLTVYFIPALAGVAMQDAGASKRARRRQVLAAAFFFILGFTLLYTATGALIGFAAQRLGDTAQFEVWQRYFGMAAGVIVIGLALRVAAKARAPLVCRMPVPLRHGAFGQAGHPPGDDARRAGVRHRVHDLFRLRARRRHGRLHRACPVGALRRRWCCFSSRWAWAFRWSLRPWRWPGAAAAVETRDRRSVDGTRSARSSWRALAFC